MKDIFNFRKFFRIKFAEKIKKFPYQYYNEIFAVKFIINNPVEQFRIVDWGLEKEYSIQLVNTLRLDDVFFDIGSSIGLNSIICSKKLSKGLVVSFEPDPEILDRLEKNYRINEITNFQICPIAIGDNEGLMNLYTAGANGFSPSLRKVNGIENYIEVEVDSIDNLLEKKVIPPPQIIKIDVEGAELLVLKGMERLLKSSYAPREIFMELHNDYIQFFDAEAKDVYNFLEKLPYSFVELGRRGEHVFLKISRN